VATARPRARRWPEVHLCPARQRNRSGVVRGDFDPLDAVGIATDRPTPYWGWGTIPDQYDRLWNGDDGETLPPEPPAKLDGLGRNPNRVIAISEYECTVVRAVETDKADEDWFSCLETS
jgi:hypothetical protein